jgi:nucleotide-binding universal stress UspA family protein
MEQPPLCPAKLEILLVCTDSSPDSQGALDGAMALAQACGSKIYLLQVLEFNPEFEAQAPEFVAQREDKIRAYMESVKTVTSQLGVPFEIRVRRGESAYAGIVEEALKIKPDMIIMGRRGGSRLFRLMMGNVTARVIGHAPFHVLVVPKGSPLAFKNILIASDGSPHSDAAWEEALYIARRVGSELTALSVARNEGELELAKAVVAELKTWADGAGKGLSSLVVMGRPYEVIIQVAKKNNMDLIVLGAMGKTGLESLLMGSVTERVIAQAPCAVLVVKKLLA